MIELSNHIERLLLTHDCVIIPDLGGLVTQYVAARYIETEKLCLPPYRCIGFNPHLTINDGLLVQSYMKTYDVSYPAAERLVKDAVGQIKKVLFEEGSYEFPGIGTLSLHMGGQYQFVPNEAGVASPELYGLDSFEIEQIKNAETEKAEKKKKTFLKASVQLKRTKYDYSLSISREVANYVAAAVVALVFYFVWAVPIQQNATTNQQEATTVYENLFGKSQKEQNVQPVSQSATEAAQNNPSVQLVTPKSENKSPEIQPQKTENTPSINKEEKSKGFTIVLASAISKKNADAYARQLVKDGFTKATPYSKGKMTRVVYGQYKDEQSARDELNRMKGSKYFSEAWIMAE